MMDVDFDNPAHAAAILAAVIAFYPLLRVFLWMYGKPRESRMAHQSREEPIPRKAAGPAHYCPRCGCHAFMPAIYRKPAGITWQCMVCEYKDDAPFRHRHRSRRRRGRYRKVLYSPDYTPEMPR